jgi:hypothetical protein
MTMSRLKNMNLILMLAISLLIPLFLAYSLYVDLSGTVLLSSDMSFEDPGDGDLSIGQDEFKVFAPKAFSILLLPGANLIGESCLLSFLLTSHPQNKPILRC